MSILKRLASASGRRDAVPNQELARELCENKNKAYIDEIAKNLFNKNKAIQSDCIKVLYEIGYIDPRLISEYVSDFLALLRSKNNRLIWGAMTALSTIALEKPGEIYSEIELVLQTIDNGSVITVDGGISVLAQISSTNEAYEETIIQYLLKHLQTCRPKEVGQHAEKSLIAMNKRNKEKFKKVLLGRLDDLTASQRTRVNKVVAHLRCN